MNSFRFLERGVEAEIARQEEIVRSGGQVDQETLHYDPHSGALTPLRSKEEAHDYRYFPEPDLVPIAPTEEMLERARAALPELPAARAERLERELGLPAETPRLLAFRSELGDFFESAVAADEMATRGRSPTGSRTSWRRGSATRTPPTPSSSRPRWRALVSMVGEGAVGGRGARGARQAGGRGRRPGQRRGVEGPRPRRCGELGEIVDRAMADQADAVEKVRRQRPGDRGDHGRRDARDQGHRRRRRGSAHDQRANRSGVAAWAGPSAWRSRSR